MTTQTRLYERAKELRFYGLLSCWDELKDMDWVEQLLGIEEEERKSRSLERRIRLAKIGQFKPLSDFDWEWPEKSDREQVEELMGLSFLEESANVVILGPNGVGKTTIAQNLAYQAILKGHTVLCTSCSAMLADLAIQDTSTALQRRLKRYTGPSLLLIDEVGYLSYDSKHGDLLFEVISKRHAEKSIVLTTNKVFKEWNEIFPSSSCVTALVDRLVHKTEIVQIAGKSYRAKEAEERAAAKAKARASKRRQAKRKLKS